MSSGTTRVGLSRPGRMFVDWVLWQRLNFLPLPHQHGSLALSTPWRVPRSVTTNRLPGHHAGVSGALPPLDALAPVHLEQVDLLELALPLATPLRSAASERRLRRVVLVHVMTAEAEGWAECVA